MATCCVAVSPCEGGCVTAADAGGGDEWNEGSWGSSVQGTAEDGVMEDGMEESEARGGHAMRSVKARMLVRAEVSSNCVKEWTGVRGVKGRQTGEEEGVVKKRRVDSWWMTVERAASERDGSLGCPSGGEHDGDAALSGGPSLYVLDVILTEDGGGEGEGQGFLW